MIKLIIFDWDDVFTLGATKGYIACYHQALLDVGVLLNPEEEKRRIMVQWGKHHKEELKELLKEYPHLVEKACHAYEQHLFGETFIYHLQFVSGSKEMLLQLSTNYILTVCTGIHPQLLQEKIMPYFNVPPLFSSIMSVYDIPDVNKHKPHPYMIRELLRKYNIISSEAIMVGDSEGDVKMAFAAGVLPIVVLTGNLTREQAEKLGVKYILENVSKLSDVLTQLA